MKIFFHTIPKKRNITQEQQYEKPDYERKWESNKLNLLTKRLSLGNLSRTALKNTKKWEHIFMHSEKYLHKISFKLGHNILE